MQAASLALLVASRGNLPLHLPIPSVARMWQGRFISDGRYFMPQPSAVTSLIDDGLAAQQSGEISTAREALTRYRAGPSQGSYWNRLVERLVEQMDMAGLER